MAIGVTSWLGENALTPYPLTRSFGYDGVLVDAAFIQFDSFIPILQKVGIEDDNLQFTLTIDSGTLITNVLISNIVNGYIHRVYDGPRLVGKFIFGGDTDSLISNLANHQSISVGISFIPQLVRSISSKAGVYSLNGLYGNISMPTDDVVSIDVSGQTATFNAVAFPAANNINVLKTLNGISPKDNLIFINDNLVLKLSATGSATLNFSLVGSELKDLQQSDAILVTNG